MTYAPIQENGGRHPNAVIRGANGHPRIWVRAVIRRDTIIYAAVEIDDHFTTGHGALVRGDIPLGDDVLV